MNDAALLSLTLWPKTDADRVRLLEGLQKLTREDPTLGVTDAAPGGAVVIAARGELQLEIIVDRLAREFHVEANVGRPQVAYKVVASRDAQKAEPVLLEPVMRVEVRVPGEYASDVTAGLSSRRGRHQSTELRGTTHVISALVPLSEMFGYASDLRERTQGRGTFEMYFDRYEPVERLDGDGAEGAFVRAPQHPLPTPRSAGIALPAAEGESES